MNSDHRYLVKLLSLCGGVLVIAAASLMVGPFPLGVAELASVILPAREPDPQVETVLLSVRLPRVVAAMLVGGALSAAGAVYQGLFRNPLVSPDILGVSTGAGLGAAIAIFLSLPFVMVQGFAFATGFATVGLVYLVASAARAHEPVLVLVLAGVVIGSLAAACISLIKYIGDPYDQLPAITFWLLGSLSAVGPRDIANVAPVVLLGLIPLVLLRWRMNVMALGDEEAHALGVDPKRLRLVFIASATLITASVVAIAGVVGWVGLVMPHIARLTVGPDFRRLLPAAILMGAAFMLVVDTIARTLTVTETPLGVLTAFLGAPVFLWLLIEGRRRW